MNRSVLARQMFANGGQAVPNEYKGFSMLPEEVQMKMDPAAAKKYKEGGEIRAGISEELRRDIDRVKAQLIEERMQQQRQTENVNALRGIRNLARYDTPVLGLDDVSKALPANEDGFNPNNIYNIARFFGENPGTTVSDYNEFFQTNLDPRDFSVLEEKAEPPAVGMAMGGDPAMAQGVGSMMPPPPDMPPAPPPMEGGQAIDPQVLEGALATAEQEITNLDQAEDFETVMNTIRGDEATVEERYEELAGVVGEEDARQTPESVLTLVQPAMVMGAVDQGIGGLAQQEMMEPVQGAMAQGIMSNVAPPPPPAAPMPPGGMGGPPPVNFKEGGLVRRGDNQPVQMYANGGETIADFRRALNIPPPVNAFPVLSQATGPVRVTPPPAPIPPPAPARGDGSRLRELVEAQKDIYREYGLGDPAARAAELESQKDLTKAQMLFDIAQTALTFAAPMQGERPGASAAERLAMAASATQLPQTIGARAQTLAEQKRAAAKEERALDLAALQSAETKLAAEVSAADAIALAKAKPKTPKPMVLLDKTGTKVLGQFNINNSDDYARARIMRDQNPGSRLSDGGPQKPNTVTIEGQVIDITDMKSPQVVFGDKKRDTKTVNGQVIDITDQNNVRVIFGTPDVKTVTVKGQVIDITKPETPKVIFGEKDPTIKIVEGQIVDITDKANPVVVFGDPKKDTAMVNGQLIDYTDSDNPKVIYGDKDTKTVTVNGEVVDITDSQNPKVIFGKPNVKTVTIDGQVVDITDPDNVKTIFGEKKRDIKIVNGQLVEIPADGGAPVPIFGERTPKTGTFENMILANGKSVIVKKVGSTLYDTNGEVIDLASDTYKDAVIVSKDTAFTASKTATKQARAQAEIDRLDRAEGDDRLSGQLRGQDDVINTRVEALGGSLSPDIEAVSFDALRAARQGVGFYNKIKQSISRVGGALVPAFRDAFADEVEAGNFIDTVNVLGRVALANSPRYAEGEQTRLADLFPDTQKLLANPENAVRKLIGLKRVMRFEYRQNLNVLAESTDSVLIRQAEQSNYAIQSVLKMLDTIPDRGVLDDTAVDATIDALRRARGQTE
jgi:ribosomal protein L29/acetolactate synthase small subunit